MAQFRKGTPTSGLELIFNIPPMEVYLTKMATKAYFRTIQHAPFTNEQLATTKESHISHRSWVKNLIDSQNLSYLESPLDVVPLHRRWDRKFEVDISSMMPQNPLRGVPDIRGLNIFTDGSKDHANTGSGVVVMDGGQVLKDVDNNEMKYTYHLDKRTTVYQSELFALKMAATLILAGSTGPGKWVSPSRDVTIHSDNQASILALNSVWVKTKLVQETLDLMD